MDAVVVHDLSPLPTHDAADNAWLSRLAASLDPGGHVLSLTDRVGRRDDDEDDPAIYRGGDGHWWAGRFIGELRFEDRELRIEPRLGVEVIGEWLAHALNLTVIPKTAAVGSSAALIAQLVDRIWSAAVADAARHGTPRLRRTTRHDELFLRGRLHAAGTVRHRAQGSPLITTTQPERDLDNPVARVLVLADHALRALLPVKPTWRPALTDAVIGQLRGTVGAQPKLPASRDLRAVRYTPITRRYQSVARLSHEIARKRGRLTSAASSDVAGVLIDVAELWELFLLHCARRAFGPAHVEHGTAERDSTFLLRSADHAHRTLGRLKPDILVYGDDGHLSAVLDAKYKRLRSWVGSPSGVDRGDLYQIAAYMAGHDVPFGALLYPPHDGDAAIADTDGPWVTRAAQRVAFSRVPAAEASAVPALRSVVDAAVGPQTSGTS